MRVTKYLKDVKIEMRKVKWPKRLEVFKGLGATIVFTSFLVAFFLLADLFVVSIKDLIFAE